MILGHHAYCAKIAAATAGHDEGEAWALADDAICTCGMEPRLCERHRVPVASCDPTGCPWCGAPQCCPKCCAEAAKEIE